MIVGFTGSEFGPQSERQSMQLEVLLFDHFVPGSEFHHGCCVGWDEVAAKMAREIGYEIYGHPPTNKKRLSSFKNDFDQTPAPYLIRDSHIVLASRVILAASYEMHETLRSGTWTTVRYAVKARRPGTVVYPDGSMRPLHEALDMPTPRRRSWIQAPTA